MLRQQERFPGSTAKEIPFSRLPEAHGLIGVGAEDHHVGEVAAFGCELGGRGTLEFSEYPAGREDGCYGVDYYAGGGEEEIACVVLPLLAERFTLLVWKDVRLL